jgi:ATP-binding protein involved in chromosome partitioning
MQTIENITKEISKIPHPAINLSLTELGIVQDIELYEKSVIITFAFPFADIPIGDKLIASVKQVVESLGFQLEYIVRVMKKEEKDTFLQMEKEAWKGL